MEITTGVHAIDDIYGAQTYLLIDDTLTLIDTGYDGNAQKILDYITAIGENPNNLSRIIATHYHPDHVGSARQLVQQTPATVLIHPAEVRRVSNDRYGVAIRMHSMGRLFRKWRSPLLPTTACEFIEEGDIIPCLGGLQVIYTPGHSPGNITLYLTKYKILFTGDAIVNTPRLLLAYLPLGGDRSQSILSAKKLAELDPEICLFSHGQPLFADVPVRLRYLADNPIHFTVRLYVKERMAQRRERLFSHKQRKTIPAYTFNPEPVTDPVFTTPHSQ